MGRWGEEVKTHYEFKVVQDDGIEIVMKIADGDISLSLLMEKLEAFLLAAGFHQMTIDAYFKRAIT